MRPATAIEETNRKILRNIRAHPPSKQGMTVSPTRNRKIENPANKKHCIIRFLLMFSMSGDEKLEM